MDDKEFLAKIAPKSKTAKKSSKRRKNTNRIPSLKVYTCLLCPSNLTLGDRTYTTKKFLTKHLKNKHNANFENTANYSITEILLPG